MSKDDFPVMLASPPKMLDRIVFPAIAQTKMDGMRAMIVSDKNTVTVYSRNGNKLIKLDNHFKSIIQHDDIVYDGELTVRTDGKILNRQAGNGICHKAIESVSTISTDEVSKIHITLWDAIPLKNFWEGKYNTPYTERLKLLTDMKPTKLHSIVDTHYVNNLDETQELYQEKIKNGEEGLILKNTNHIWENKRSTQIVKMKEELDIDLKVVDWNEGEGKYTGKLGALVCENNKGDIRVSVGAGLTDLNREQLTKDKIIGKIITVKYTGIIKRKTDKMKSLFLPRFVEVRPDKTKAD